MDTHLRACMADVHAYKYTQNIPEFSQVLTLIKTKLKVPHKYIKMGTEQICHSDSSRNYASMFEPSENNEHDVFLPVL